MRRGCGTDPPVSQDHAFLHSEGVAAVFGPGTRIPAAASAIIKDLDKMLAE